MLEYLRGYLKSSEYYFVCCFFNCTTGVPAAWLLFSVLYCIVLQAYLQSEVLCIPVLLLVNILPLVLLHQVLYAVYTLCSKSQVNLAKHIESDSYGERTLMDVAVSQKVDFIRVFRTYRVKPKLKNLALSVKLYEGCVYCVVFTHFLFHSFVTYLQGYPQRMRLQRRLVGIYTACFLIFMISCTFKIEYFLTKSFNKPLIYGK